VSVGTNTTSGPTLDACRDARIDGLESALAILAAMALGALFFAQRIPTIQPGKPQLGAGPAAEPAS
jgi:hypothetical protein